MGAKVDTVCRLDATHLPDELLSIVVFGPGTGEAVLLRLPDGKVAVIDGCRGKPQQADPVHDLATDLGVARLFFACLTHPHEDHFGGLVDLIGNFRAEHLIWAGTEHERLLNSLVSSYRDHQIRGDAIPDGIPPDELKRLVRELTRATQRRGRANPTARSQGLADHKLLFTLHCQPDLEIWGVLPTTTALHRALGRNTSVPVKVSDDQEPIAPGQVDPNDISGALLIRWGSTRVLLGGDVLTGRPSHHEGWSCADWISGPVQVVKVPHHASEGAHCQDLWDRLKPSIAVVTPFRNASGPMPPKESMLHKLAAQAQSLFVTSRPAWWPGNGTLAVDRDWPELARVLGTPLAGARAPTNRYGASGRSRRSTAAAGR